MTGIENITFSEWADLHDNIVPSGEKCYLVTLYEDTNGTTNKNIIENMSVSTIAQTEAENAGLTVEICQLKGFIDDYRNSEKSRQSSPKKSFSGNSSPNSKVSSTKSFTSLNLIP